MHELAPPDYPIIAAFFPEGTSGRPYIHALLEGNHTGRVFVDDAVRPKTVLVALACEFHYVAGQADNPAIQQAIYDVVTRELASTEEPTLVFPTATAWEGAIQRMFAKAPLCMQIKRSHFAFDASRFRERHSHWRTKRPDGYRVRRYDRALASTHDLPRFWGSVEAFLDRGFGFAVAWNDTPVSRCHSVMIGAGQAEIEIETLEEHRQRGLAALAASAFIEHCLQAGLTPGWSCWDNNGPSHTLARYLGFVHQGDIPAYLIRPR